MLFLELFQQRLQLYISVTRAIEHTVCICEAEDDVVGGAAMKMRQQFLDTEAKHDCQTRLVWLQQDAYTVHFIEIADVPDDFVEILLVNIRSPCVRYARRVDDANCKVASFESVGGWILSCRLAGRRTLLVLAFSDANKLFLKVFIRQSK